MGQCPIIALGGRYCQNLTVNLIRPGSSFSTTRLHPPPPQPLKTKAQNRRIRAPSVSARNAGIRNLYLVGYLYPRCVRNDKGRFPFNKNSGLKFRKFSVFNGTVQSGSTDPTQATARLVIVLASRIQKSGTGDNNFVKWKGTFRSDRPK